MIAKQTLHFVTHHWKNRNTLIMTEQKVIDAAQSETALDVLNGNVEVAKSKIVTRANNVIRRIRDHVTATLATSAQLLKKCGTTRSEFDLLTPIDTLENSLAKIQTKSQLVLVEYRAAVEDRRRDLDEFKKVNRLSRRASYPDSIILAAAIPVALLLVETFFNTRLFAEADRLGFLGGTTLALVVASINVLPSLLVGFIPLRRFFHVRKAFRWAARIAATCSIGAIVFCNIYVYQYRAHMSQQPDEIEALGLLVLGLVTATLAIFDGYIGFDDRYAGYGKVDRAYRDARVALTNVLLKFKSQVEHDVDSSLEDVETRFKRFESKSTDADEFLVIAIKCVRESEESVRQIERRCVFLLARHNDEVCKMSVQYQNTNTMLQDELKTEIGANSADVAKLREQLRCDIAGKFEEVRRAQTTIVQMRDDAISCLGDEYANGSGRVNKALNGPGS